MNSVNLNEAHFFTIEPKGKKFRLIISDGINELACRKETINNLHKFCAAENCRIFKGRLQFFKTGKTISIEIKGTIIGKINTTNFLKILRSCLSF